MIRSPAAVSAAQGSGNGCMLTDVGSVRSCRAGSWTGSVQGWDRMQSNCQVGSLQAIVTSCNYLQLHLAGRVG